MKWLRGLLIADPAIIAITLFFGTLSLLVSFFDENGRKQSNLARPWARLLLAVSGIKVHVDGLQHIDPNGSYIFVANHLSFIDTPLVMAHIPVQFRFLAKRGLFQIPIIGTHLTRAGHIPVPREDPRAGVKVMQLAAEVIKEKKISLLIFPEGGRTRDGLLRPFKEGGAYIAIRAGVPIIPLVLMGTREILPMGSAVVEPGTVTLRILKPIETQGLNLKDRGSITDQLHSLILSELEAAGQNVGTPTKEP